ncbi:pilus assembly protein TadG-related protein [Aquibium sp. A9E412]|uniref:pilus assembly protein TadG-related protein n=1 Tax=Aquibium sp. A9E412 TaxID=2976767 RepID=UPI0025B0C18C|nr:pilus assembly protein TadG-related protein [Aquibium sp. A9E412]MDN2566394.1 pilus assembly protein TadG-related protein [Aquibium sp. A9E412]
MLRRFRKDENANVAVFTALAAVPFVAAVAGAIDFASAQRKAEQLQNALDAAAFAIAIRYYDGMGEAELQAIGQDFVEANGPGVAIEAGSVGYTDGWWDSFAAKIITIDGYDHVTVDAATRHQGILGSFDWPLRRSSVVRIQPGPPACALALDRDAAAAVKIQGSTDITMTGCVIAANSRSSSAIDRGGSARLTAACVSTAGATEGIDGTSNVALDCAAALENQYPSADPLAGVAPPSYTGCQPLPGGKSVSLSPGTYCNKTFSGEIVLSPGSYILRGGRINLGGNGSLTGHGVTLFLMDGAEFSINANQIVDLTPPDSGPYAGITIYQEADNTNAVTINGTSGSHVEGFVYAPGAHVFYAGNATTQADRCLRLVGRTIELTGNASIALDCAAELGGREMRAGRVVGLVD